ncbi:hypothetical protein BGZ92_003697 [Podila epicladia]|nr:hypothetical protein BGZ92_003697 [Podila epicladia]
MSQLTSLFRYVLLFAVSSEFLAVILAFMTFYVYKHRSHAIGSRRRQDLKQPKGVFPILGHLPLLASVPSSGLYQFFEKQYNELGPVWSITLPIFGRIIQIDSAENVEHVLKTNSYNFEKGGAFKGILEDLLGTEGINLNEGEKWRFVRSLTSRVFNTKAYREYTSDIFVTEGRKVINYLDKASSQGTVVDFQALMLYFTLDCLGSTLFGETFGCLENIEHGVAFGVSLDELLETCTKRLINPLWKIQERMTSVDKKVKHDRQSLRNHALEIIEKRRKHGNDAHRKDFLQFFLDSEDNKSQPLSDDLLIDNMLTFAVAGRDTTAHALTWMFYLIYRDDSDENIQTTLVREVDDVLGGSIPTNETFKNLKFAEAWYDHITKVPPLRIFPPVPRNLRYCVKEDILPDGTKVYAGEWVAWSSYVMGRSESVWGPDAKEFRPSRWINSVKPSLGKFNSFGLGPRACPGQQYATIQALTVISMILQHFDVKLEEPSKVPTYATSLAFPMIDGLKIRVSRRQL